MRRSVLQGTVKDSFTFKGIGLHTGHSIDMKVCPAKANTGIRFVRTDIEGHPEVLADVDYVVGTMRGTILQNGLAEVHTVEHLLAAFRGMGIDNALVELSGDEVPVGDGSSRLFCEEIKRVGIRCLGEERKVHSLKNPVFVGHKDMFVLALPSASPRMKFVVDFDHPQVDLQTLTFDLNTESFESELADARTFCFESELDFLRKQGLIKGGSLENAVVIGDNGVLNDSLRFDDECVRHKMLDLIGDLGLLGFELDADIVAVKSGHSLNVNFVKEVRTRMREKEMAVEQDQPYVYDIKQIQEIIPHRYPFLLIDRIVHMEGTTRAVGLKNVTTNEEFFKGHFPGHPVMPGVLIVEALAQTAAVMMLKEESNRGKIAYFMSVDKVKFRKPVVPGDQLMLDVEMLKLRGKVGVAKGKAYVAGVLVTEGEFKFSLFEG